MSIRTLAVIGNGATGVDDNGQCYINLNTAKFLSEISNSIGRVFFIQPRTLHKSESNLHNSLAPDCCRFLTLTKGLSGLISFDFISAFFAIVHADLVYIFYPGKFPELVARICRMFGKPYAIYLRGDPRENKFFKPSTLKEAKFVTTVSTKLAATCGAKKEATERIRPMIGMTEKDAYTRNYLARNTCDLRLLFVGRIEAEKGIYELLDAALILINKKIKFRLTIVGGGPLLDAAKEYAEKKSISSAIEFTGPVSDPSQLQRLYEHNEVLVLPTYHEGFPRVLYEAMIKSMVIITTPVGGIPDIMSDGVNCVFSQPRNAENLALCIDSICRDAEFMQRIADAGHLTAINVLREFRTHAEIFIERSKNYV